ncbi:MAG: hypothetical protein K4H23_04405 [Mollicutes bacterium PWAP]|nr:hypothetical protein [Mollicutes bacterium PWAP]
MNKKFNIKKNDIKKWNELFSLDFKYDLEMIVDRINKPSNVSLFAHITSWIFFFLIVPPIIYYANVLKYNEEVLGSIKNKNKVLNKIYEKEGIIFKSSKYNLKNKPIEIINNKPQVIENTSNILENSNIKVYGISYHNLNWSFLFKHRKNQIFLEFSNNTKKFGNFIVSTKKIKSNLKENISFERKRKIYFYGDDAKDNFNNSKIKNKILELLKNKYVKNIKAFNNDGIFFIIINVYYFNITEMESFRTNIASSLINDVYNKKDIVVKSNDLYKEFFNIK